MLHFAHPTKILALVKGVRFAALASGFIFAIVHFRVDIIPLFIGGII